MPIYHMVIFKLKTTVTESQIEELTIKAKAMVGKIPGLTRLDVNPPLEITKHRANGFNFGLVAILDKVGDVGVYAEHPAHKEVHALREAICDETLVYDMEF